MTNDASSGPPNRPRSTPIPDPDGQARLPPPPTAAQFLGGQPSLPWTPQPGPDVNRVFQGDPGRVVPPAGEPRASGSSLARVVVVLILLVAIGGVGAAMYLGTSRGDSATRPATGDVPVLPPLATFAAPPVSTSVISTATTTEPTTGPMDGSTDASALPGGGTSLYADGAARVVADQLELALSGDPTQLTVVYVFADDAIATAEDPEHPGRLIGASWRDGTIGDVGVTSTGGSGDLSARRFTEGEVNWESIAALVAQAAGLLDITDGQVTYVAVQRTGVGGPPPIVIDVFVDGPSGRGYVEASAAGDVQSVNNG